MKKNKKLIIFLIILLVLSIIPLPIMRNDGGTIEYNAILYQVIIWHEINPSAVYDENGRYVVGAQPQFLTGTSFYIFPSNFLGTKIATTKIWGNRGRVD